MWLHHGTDDGTRTLRKREHGGRSLPLPPLLDPVAVKAKSRYRDPKPLPSKLKEKTEFQRELEANPHAQALAMPVRQCALTNARLPAHFLLPLVSYIEPQAIDGGTVAATRPSKYAVVHLVPDLDLNIPRDLRSPARSYVLAQQHILEYFGSKRRWTQVVTERMKRWFALKTGRQWHSLKVQKEWKWDDATPENVLEKFRDEVVTRLVAAIEGIEVSIIRAGNMPRAANEVRAVGCFLRLKHHEHQYTGVDGLGASRRDLSDQGIRVYDLAYLLGEEDLARVVNITDLIDKGRGSWVMVPLSPRTVELQLQLLKLEAYLRNETA
ncbi:hypothetical protein LTR85_000805 [Meristemomyces frigidus]|nr:hypothetical protein LTR85_000805 [Meristemomyces frigidus]